MNKAAIEHIAGDNYAFPVDENTLVIRLRAAKRDLQKVTVVYGSRYALDGRDPNQVKELALVASDEEHDYFTTTISLPDARFRYHFFLDDGKEQYWYNEKGFSKTRPSGFKAGFFQYAYINTGDIFRTPEWVRDAVFYEIFPERFRNGDPANDPENVQPWGELPSSKSFFGGDLKGIEEKLDYIQELGANALYLTPIFLSPTNHKYDTTDYRVDPHFGDLATAKRLVDEAHSRGIRVILDAVFNHSGFDFFAFKDVREEGTESKYADWYLIKDFPVRTTPPVNYYTFANNVVSMPKLRTENPQVQEYILGVVEYWTRELDLDGWRLDVADEVDPELWRRFRKTVKSIKPDAYIVGEIWHDARPWLRGEMYDAVMNYPFMEACLDFFARGLIGPTTFNGRLAQKRMLYNDSVNYVMLNLLDSHDTARALHYFGEDKARFKLAVLFQMTYVGAPMVYYGDELGMTGGDDPDCRRCMIWDESEQDRGLLEYYRKLIRLRHELAPLRRGDFRTLITDELRNVYGFKRVFGEEQVIVILNNSPFDQEVAVDAVDVGETVTGLRNLISGAEYLRRDGVFRIKLGALEGAVLKVIM